MLKMKLNKIIPGIILLIFCLGIFFGCNISISSSWGKWQDTEKGRECVKDSHSRECRLTDVSITTDTTDTPNNRW